jgi:hypothetical protein
MDYKGEEDGLGADELVAQPRRCSRPHHHLRADVMPHRPRLRTVAALCHAATFMLERYAKAEA